MRISSGLARAERLVEGASAVLLAMCVAAVSTQIVLRYVFNAATSWSDPVASDSLAWLTFLGAAAAVRSDGNLYVRFAWKWLSPPARKGLETFSHLVVLLSSMALLYSARVLIDASRGTIVEGIPWHVSMAEVYSVTAVSAALMVVFTVEHVVVLWTRPRP